MINLNEDALDIIINLFNSKKFMNVAKLTTTYNKREIDVLITTSNGMIQIIELGAKEGILNKHFNSVSEALMFKMWLEGQKMLFNRAVLNNENAEIFTFRTLENGICESILHQN
jgi:hypothetical protein